jgi:DnaD/phage-associated family protein
MPQRRGFLFTIRNGDLPGEDMKRQWIKLYLEILNDPKMGKLSDWLWRRAIELFLLAGENGDDGLLQPVTDLAWRLRTSEAKLTESLVALSEVGVVHETPDGWCVTHFKDRQYCESFERVKRYRNAHSNAVVAENESPLLSSNSLSDSDSSSPSTENVFRVYEKNIGMITPMIADGIKADVDQYSEEWVKTAIEYATRQEKRSLSYVEGCLRGWKRDGLAKPPAINAERQKQEKGSRVDFLKKLAEA